MSNLPVSRHWIDGAWLESGQSGQRRLRGLAVIDDFIEYKHIALGRG